MNFTPVPVILLLIVTVVRARSTDEDECRAVMRDANITDKFAKLVAHRIHSLTTEDLRYYFKSDASEENNVPTVNFNLSSPDRVLPNAPLYGYDTNFTTIGLQHLDLVLRHMDRENWGLTGYNVLELITHRFHMAEMWTGLQPIYRSFEKARPSEEVCTCLKDTEKNGILQSLKLLALQIKYPGITSGNRADDKTDTGKNKQLVKVEALEKLNKLLIKDLGEYIEATGVGNKDVDAGVYETDDEPDTGVYKTGVYEIYDQLEKRNADAGVYHEVVSPVKKRNADAGVYQLAPLDKKRNADAGVYHEAVSSVKKRNADAGVYRSGVKKRNADAGVYHEVVSPVKKRNAEVYKRNSRDVLVKEQKNIPLQTFDFDGNEEDVVSRASEELVDGIQAFTARLVNEEGWAAWRDDVKKMDKSGQYETAMFLYCILNEK